MPTGTYLDEIVAAHRARARADQRDLRALFARAEEIEAPRGFSDHIADHRGLAIVAEVKRRSPSKGDIYPDLSPEEVARDYSAGGAACLSVLTDEDYFAGSAEDLRAARAACTLPVLRKDFTVSEADVCDARIMGADAVLLLVAALSEEELGTFHTLARELAMDVLVEVHDEDELERALDVGAQLVGVNQRDLRTFEVDGKAASRLAAAIPSEVVAVAESGIGGPDDARALADAGFQAALVGESLLRSPDRVAAVSALDGFDVGSRSFSGDSGVSGNIGKSGDIGKSRNNGHNGS